MPRLITNALKCAQWGTCNTLVSSLRATTRSALAKSDIRKLAFPLYQQQQSPAETAPTTAVASTATATETATETGPIPESSDSSLKCVRSPKNLIATLPVVVLRCVRRRCRQCRHKGAAAEQKNANRLHTPTVGSRRRLKTKDWRLNRVRRLSKLFRICTCPLRLCTGHVI